MKTRGFSIVSAVVALLVRAIFFADIGLTDHGNHPLSDSEKIMELADFVSKVSRMDLLRGIC